MPELLGVLLRKSTSQPGMGVHTHNPSIGEVEAENQEFKASLSYIVRLRLPGAPSNPIQKGRGAGKKGRKTPTIVRAWEC